MSSNGATAVLGTASPILFEVWDTVRCCVLGCFTSIEAAAQFMEPNGLSETCEIREYTIG